MRSVGNQQEEDNLSRLQALKVPEGRKGIFSFFKWYNPIDIQIFINLNYANLLYSYTHRIILIRDEHIALQIIFIPPNKPNCNSN